MTNYEFAVNAFNSILGIIGKPFDNQKGVSDDIKGVQWNIGITKNGEAKLGVNLEGMKYKNWPISTFLEKELKNPRLPSLAKVTTDANKIHIKLDRDAWRVRQRPPIKEKNIAGSGTSLSELTETVWNDMLNQAYSCLNSDKNYRGRAKQFVTLIPSGEEKKMEVSPHLGINTTVWSSVPNSEDEAKSKLQEAFSRLRPLYDFVKETSGDLQTVKQPGVADYPDALTDIANAASIADSLTEKERDVYTKARIGQGMFRERLVKYWERCSVTGCEETSILIASHIKPWRSCTVAEATTMTNGLLLIPNLDSLFDKGFISFDKDGAILLSPQLSSAVADQLGVKKSMRLSKIIPQHQPYLEFHRTNIFLKSS
jgi:hypothetical protein